MISSYEESHRKNRRRKMEDDINYSKIKRNIVFSRAFRRLKGKTQVITDLHNDNCRTRISHTVDVVNIASDIAEGCMRDDVNLGLVEIIAYAHDVGHAPFGHAGERALHKITSGNNEHFPTLNAILNKYPEYKGFKHNLQGVRLFADLEQGVLDRVNKRIKARILYGIGAHTSLTYKPNNTMRLMIDEYSPHHAKSSSRQNTYIRRWNAKKILRSEIQYYDQYRDILSEENASVEAEIVSIADEIAQLVENIEDGYTLQLIDVKSLLRVLTDYFEGYDSWYFNQMKSMELGAPHKEEKVIIRELSNFLIDVFKKDIIEQLDEHAQPGRYKTYRVDSRGKKSQTLQIERHSQLFGEISMLLDHEVIRDHCVRSMDVKAENNIVEIFDYYLSSPKRLPEDTRRTFSKRLDRLYLRTERSSYKIEDLDDLVNLIFSYKYNSTRQSSHTERNINISEKMTERLFLELIRVITDHIAGMTDQYLLARLKELRVT